MNHNKEAKSLTFWRGSEVSQVCGCWDKIITYDAEIDFTLYGIV